MTQAVQSVGYVSHFSYSIQNQGDAKEPQGVAELICKTWGSNQSPTHFYRKVNVDPKNLKTFYAELMKEQQEHINEERNRRLFRKQKDESVDQAREIENGKNQMAHQRKSDEQAIVSVKDPSVVEGDEDELDALFRFQDS